MQKINKFNQFLLEKYPTIWNTKIVWMLLAGIIVHILFFIIGYISHIDPKSLQTSYVTDDYFRDGIILIHLIISILMIVGWLILMFKNNAFKNFYPNSKGKLFSQFFQYFVIIFVCTTFYFSYMIGFKMFINSKYPDAEMKEDIEIINRGSAFLSQDLELYTLDNRLSPTPFYNLYCETDIKNVDRTKRYHVYYNRVYQFYTMYSKTYSIKDKSYRLHLSEFEKSNGIKSVKSELNKDSETFYFKKDVVDLSSYIKTGEPNFYNFSEIFYDYYFMGFDDGTGAVDGDYYYYDKNSANDDLKKRKAEINRKTAELLDKNNSAEIEKLLSKFLKISKKFAIENNLNAKQWMNMVYQPTDFKIRYFIKKSKPVPDEEYDPNNPDYYEEAATETIDSAVSVVEADAAIVDQNGEIINDTILIRDFNPEIDKHISPKDYFKRNLTDYYFYTDNLKDFLASIDDVKSYDFFSENLHIYLWIAFFLATFIFSFRITGLRSLLFSVISVGILILVVTLLTVIYSVTTLGKEDYFASYLALFTAIFILAVPIFAINKFNKLITSIFVNISLNGFVMFVFLIFGIVIMHQKDACRFVEGNCETIFDVLGFGLSYIVLVSGFLFMYFYTKILLKWKARAE